MRQVFQYLAFVALGCAALLSSCQRPEIPEPETLPSQLAVNFTIGLDASDTKAVKTAWENGDVVFIFFNGITTNGSGAAKYLKLTWNSSNSSWTSTPMGGLTASDLDALQVKFLTAVYPPFSANATVNYDSSEGFTFDPAPRSLLWHSQPVGYVLEASADLNTTVLSLVEIDNLAMSVPDGFIQFFLDDANATAQAASDHYLAVSRVHPATPRIGTNGGVTLSIFDDRWIPAYFYDKQNKDSGDSKGYLFSGVLDSEYRGRASNYSIAYRSSSDNIHFRVLSDYTFYLSPSFGRTFKIDPSNWSPGDFKSYIGPFKVSKNKQVAFSPGNLVVTYRSNGQHEWAFESNQYDFGYGNEEPGQTYYGLSNYEEVDGTRASHFGWGTGDRPFYLSSWPEDYDTFVDWGLHFDKYGSGRQDMEDGTWFTPSREEWDYLISGRPNADRLWGKGRIYVEELGKYVKGLFIFPDGMEEFVDLVGFTPGVTDNYTTNSYTTGSSSAGFNGRWEYLEMSLGAMFLPAACHRSGYQDNPCWYFYELAIDCGSYWTSTGDDAQTSLEFAFKHYESTAIYNVGTDYIRRHAGLSVRLAHVWDPTYMFNYISYL